MGWTTKREKYLRKHWLEGADARTIAIEIGDGVTRNAVLGKVHRMELKRNSTDPLKVSPNRPLEVKDKQDGETATAFKKRKAKHDAILEIKNTRTLDDMKRLMAQWVIEGKINT